MKKCINYSLFFPTDTEIILSRDEIMGILFHRDRMLLLDRVTISNGKTIGEFTVPAENCIGHEPISGMPVMRGVEIPEMAFQLLGVITAQLTAKDPELADALKDKKCLARRIDGAEFTGIVRPGDKLILENKNDENNSDVCISGRSGFLKITSGKMIARVGNKEKCIITSVVFLAVDKSLIDTQRA